jgi:hypothetical protein
VDQGLKEVGKASQNLGESEARESLMHRLTIVEHGIDVEGEPALKTEVNGPKMGMREYENWGVADRVPKMELTLCGRGRGYGGAWFTWQGAWIQLSWTSKKKKNLHMATGNPATQASRKAPIPAMKPLTLRNGSRCGQGYRIPNPYPHPRDP